MYPIITWVLGSLFTDHSSTGLEGSREAYDDCVLGRLSFYSSRSCLDNTKLFSMLTSVSCRRIPLCLHCLQGSVAEGPISLMRRGFHMLLALQGFETQSLHINNWAHCTLCISAASVSRWEACLIPHAAFKPVDYLRRFAGRCGWLDIDQLQQ